MKKILFLTILLNLFVCATFSQTFPKLEKCKVTVEKLPQIRGLYLGMSFSQIKSKFRNLVTTEKNRFNMQVGSVEEITQPDFSDVQKILFTFMDDELMSFEITYKRGTNFKTVEAFSTTIATSLGLPNSWSVVTLAGTGGSGEMQCYGFKIKTSLVTGSFGEAVKMEIEDPYRALNATNRLNILEQQKAAEADRRTNTFKP